MTTNATINNVFEILNQCGAVQEMRNPQGDTLEIVDEEYWYTCVKVSKDGEITKEWPMNDEELEAYIIDNEFEF